MPPPSSYLDYLASVGTQRKSKSNIKQHWNKTKAGASWKFNYRAWKSNLSPPLHGMSLNWVTRSEPRGEIECCNSWPHRAWVRRSGRFSAPCCTSAMVSPAASRWYNATNTFALSFSVLRQIFVISWNSALPAWKSVFVRSQSLSEQRKSSWDERSGLSSSRFALDFSVLTSKKRREEMSRRKCSLLVITTFLICSIQSIFVC